MIPPEESLARALSAVDWAAVRLWASLARQWRREMEESRKAFEAYCEAGLEPGRAFDGSDIPSWEKLPPGVTRGWAHFAAAALSVPPPAAAESGYLAYGEAVSWARHNGEPMPGWRGVDPATRLRFAAAACAAAGLPTAGQNLLAFGSAVVTHYLVPPSPGGAGPSPGRWVAACGAEQRDWPRLVALGEAPPVGIVDAGAEITGWAGMPLVRGLPLSLAGIAEGFAVLAESTGVSPGRREAARSLAAAAAALSGQACRLRIPPWELALVLEAVGLTPGALTAGRSRLEAEILRATGG